MKALTSRHVLSIALLVATLVLPATARGVDFLRGDANEDGSVSISDSHFIFAMLFQSGAQPGCLKAVDANDDGRTDIGDGVLLLNYLFGGGVPAPPAPYPSVGSDATADGLTCASYGGGAPLDDPAAAITVLDASAAGGDDGAATIVLGVSSSSALAGYSCRIHPSSAVFEQALASSDLSGTLSIGYHNARLVDGDLVIGFLGSFVDPEFIQSGQDTPVLEVVVCLAPGTPAGSYDLTVVEGELVDGASARAIPPALGGGSLAVAADVSTELVCEYQPPLPSSPDEVDVRLELEKVAPTSGADVDVALAVQCNVPVQGVDFSIDFDEEALELASVEATFVRGDGAPWDFLEYTINNDNATPGGEGVDEGYVAGHAIVGIEGDNRLPGRETRALTLAFNDGTGGLGCALVTFADGGLHAGSAVTNAIVALDQQSISGANAKSFSTAGLVLSLGSLPGAARPDELDAEYRLPSVAGTPGASVTLPLTVLANAEVQGLAVSLDFDETVLTGTAVEQVHLGPGTWDFYVAYIENSDEIPGDSGIQEGSVMAAGVFSFFDEGCVNVQAGVPTEVFAFRFDIALEAAGGVTEIRFVDGALSGAGPSAIEVENVVTAFGESIDPDVMSSFVFFDGVVNIAPDIAVFIRGDADGSGTVEISDPQRTLGYLFRGGPPPACFDAADANDDGSLDIPDPIRTLGYLFLGSAPLPAPFPEPGSDPTDDDSMGCLSRR